MQHLHFRRATLLLIFSLVSVAVITIEAAIVDEFVKLPAELASKAPDRLVFNQKDLALCLSDNTAERCILSAPIKLDEDTWRDQLAASSGTVTISAAQSPVTITSGPCRDCPSIDKRPPADASPFAPPRLERLDWGEVAGAIALQPGAKLRLVNLHLSNFAYKSQYQYSPTTPYFSVGVGMSIWPTVNLAPNSTCMGLNISGTYVNPSDTDDCPRYVQKSLSYLMQSFGPGNITVISPTSTMIIGPITVTVPVRNGSSEVPVGNATTYYKYLTIICTERKTSTSGMSPGILAAAIAAPVGAAVAAAGLLLWWYSHRKRARKAAKSGSSKEHAESGLLKDAEQGDSSTHNRQGKGTKQAMSSSDIMVAWVAEQQRMLAACAGSAALTSDTRPSGSLQHQHSLATTSRGDPVSVGRRSTADSPPRPTPQSSMAASAYLPAIPWAAAAAASASAPHGPNAGLAYASHAEVQAPAVPVPINRPSTRGPPSTGAGALDGIRHHSSVTCEPGTPSAVATPVGSLLSQHFSTAGLKSGRGRSGDHRADTTTAVLKARSDAAVLKELKLGSLLGQGCYGRVYKGRWKATPVAVKIIDHYSSHEGVGSSRGNRISAGRELLFATSISHPNLVNTYHISTLSTTQRTAAASLNTASSSSASAGAAGSIRRSESTSSAASSGSNSTDDGQPEMLETWIVMELCEKGSLERAMKQGKLKKADGQPDMNTIYNVLLDTASGLDYLHSIGVVHGDLKTANVLLKGSSKDAKGVGCKITDFGLSRVLDMNASHISTGTHGTIVYMPKELLLSGRMTQATDIYSFGLMMWELYCSQHIMDSDEGTSVGQMFYAIAYQNWRPEIPAGCPQGYAELMAVCWHDDPEQRPTANQLLRRLQVLQGQARQESVSARKAHKLTARAAEQGLSFEESAPSGSEAAGPSLCSGPQRCGTGSLGPGTAGSANCSCFADQSGKQQQRSDGVLVDASNACPAPLAAGGSSVDSGAWGIGQDSCTHCCDAAQHAARNQSAVQQQGEKAAQHQDCVSIAAAPRSCSSGAHGSQLSDQLSSKSADGVAGTLYVHSAAPSVHHSAPVHDQSTLVRPLHSYSMLSSSAVSTAYSAHGTSPAARAPQRDSFEGYQGSTTVTEQQLQAMQCTLAIHDHQQSQQMQPMVHMPAPPVHGAQLSEAAQYLQHISWAQQCAGATDPYARAGLVAAVPFDVSQLAGAELQRQWGVGHVSVNACPPELGFVSPYGQEFAGCLPEFNASEDGTGNDALMSSYIAALDAAAAARGERAAGR